MNVLWNIEFSQVFPFLRLHKCVVVQMYTNTYMPQSCMCYGQFPYILILAAQKHTLLHILNNCIYRNEYQNFDSGHFRKFKI